MKQTKAWQVFDVKQRAINEAAIWKAAGNKAIVKKVKQRAYPGKIFYGVFVYPKKEMQNAKGYSVYAKSSIDKKWKRFGLYKIYEDAVNSTRDYKRMGWFAKIVER